MDKKIIAVIGATGSQGKGIVQRLVENGTFKVRAISRNPENYNGPADEVVFGDLEKVESLSGALQGAYGVFVVTNFWAGVDEIKQGKNAIEAAKHAKISHFIWSSLPNVEKISKGAFDVPHFTHKAKVDDEVLKAGFQYSTIVQAPFYFQNFMGMLAPQDKPDGTKGWTLPIHPNAKVIHMGDISEFGLVVLGAFLNPEKSGHGAILSFAAELKSFNEIIADYQSNGKSFTFTEVKAEVFSSFFPGAGELANMFKYFEAHQYMGPDGQAHIDLANKLVGKPFTTLREWIKAS